MAQSKDKTLSKDKDLRDRVDQIIERAEKELLHASRQLSDGIDRGANRVVPPVSDDLEHLVDDVFDFAERVIQGQRRMVKEMVSAFNEQVDRAQVAGRKATKQAAKHVQARQHAGTRHRPTSKTRTTSGTKVPAQRGAKPARAKKSATGKATAKKAS